MLKTQNRNPIFHDSSLPELTMNSDSQNMVGDVVNVENDITNDFAKCHNEKDIKSFELEEALTMTGIGLYNYTLFAVNVSILIAALVEMFSVSILVKATQCDLELTAYQSGLIGSIPMLGVVISAYTWGYIADTKGRKFTLNITMTGTFLSAIVSSFSNSFLFLAITKLFSAIFASGTNSVVYAMLGESTPQSSRSRFLLFCSTCVLLTQGIIVVLAYSILSLDFEVPLPILGFSYRPWRLLIQLYGLMSGVMIFFLLYYTMESPKFDLSNGNPADCLKTLSKIFSINSGRPAEDYPVKKITLEENLRPRSDNLLAQLWKQSVPLLYKAHIKNTLLISYVCIMSFSVGQPFVIWLPVIFNLFFRGTGESSEMNFCQILQSGSGGENSTMQVCDDKLDDVSLVGVGLVCIYITILATSFVPIINRFGKRNIFIYTHIVCATAGYALNYVYGTWSLIVFNLMTSNAVCMGIATAYAVELFPTYMRAMAVCLTIMIGRGFSFIVINVIRALILDHCSLLFFLFPTFILSGSVIGWFLPLDNKSTANATEENKQDSRS